uniref:Uncharacterized protein n=1 Tax=Arundo donax TaxID=35708 RepID=A0A0A9AIL4_ARUDO
MIAHSCRVSCSSNQTLPRLTFDLKYHKLI